MTWHSVYFFYTVVEELLRTFKTRLNSLDKTRVFVIHVSVQERNGVSLAPTMQKRGMTDATVRQHTRRKQQNTKNRWRHVVQYAVQQYKCKYKRCT